LAQFAAKAALVIPLAVWQEHTEHARNYNPVLPETRPRPMNSSPTSAFWLKQIEFVIANSQFYLRITFKMV
jgi:hypothetical protein